MLVSSMPLTGVISFAQDEMNNAAESVDAHAEGTEEISEESHTHNYVRTEIDSYHTKKGIYAEVCSVCNEVNATEATTKTFTNEYPESDHNYSNYFSETWTYNAPETVQSLNIKFSSNTETEQNYDHIYIYTLGGSLVGDYSGSDLAGKTVTVPGSGFKIKLTSDNSNTYYGFSIISISGLIAKKHNTVENIEYTSRVKKAATCTEKGVTEYTCSDCGLKYEASDIGANGHKYKSTTTKATLSKSGSIVKKCTVCGKVSESSTITYPKTIKLSETSVVYNGKAQSPAVTVKDKNGNALKKDTDYTVKYASGRKNVGKYDVTITFKGNYSGTKTLSFKIVPAETEITSLSGDSCAFTVNWKKQSSQVSGYQLQYSTSGDFSSAKTVTTDGSKTVTKTVSKLKASTKYYVRVRTYKTVGDSKYYSNWSAKKSVTTKPAVEIKLKSSSATLCVGGTKTLSYSTYPTKVTVSWKSSDTSVAKVSSDGKVTAVKKGTATITASFKNGGKTYKATCEITVKNPSLKLDKTSVTLSVKSSVTLSATTMPSSATVTWKSSDASVAKVSSSGKVTGVKAGTATITASISYHGKTYKSTCKVTVKKASDKDRYNKVVDYIKKNGEIERIYSIDGVEYVTIIGEENGVLDFFITQTANNYIYNSAFIKYKYGDTYAKEVGTTEMYDEVIMRFGTNIPVKDFDRDYSLRYSIDYLTMYEDAVDSSLRVQHNLVNTGFIYWNAQLKNLFGFGMNEIGFSSWE